MRRRALIALAAAVLGAAFLIAPSAADAAVSGVPAATPQLAPDGTTDQVRQLTQCGGTMYAVGGFTLVKDAGSTTAIRRNNAFSFSATSPYRINSWNPNVNGYVDTVACGAAGSVLLGGTFTSAGGAANRNLARVSDSTGASLGFAFHPSGEVEHVEVMQGHLLVGGKFPGYLASVNPTTGQPDGYPMPAISGTYQYPGSHTGGTRIHNMSPSPDGTAVILSGTFTSVGGQHHEQLVRLNLTPGAPTVSAWEPTELEMHCAGVEPYYARDAAWSPDGSTIYTGTTGYHLDGAPLVPAQGPCDALIAYPAQESRFDGHLWINYTGCDSFYAVAADTTTVFAGGHQRWLNNQFGCDYAGPGAIPQPGLAEVDPYTGAYQPGPNRGRGLGADDLLRTSAGLWIASDNLKGTDSCAGVHGHAGICFLPNAGY